MAIRIMGLIGLKGQICFVGFMELEGFVGLLGFVGSKDSSWRLESGPTTYSM